MLVYDMDEDYEEREIKRWRGGEIETTFKGNSIANKRWLK